MLRCEDERARALLDALLAGPPAPGLAERAAAALGLPEHGRYVVAVLPAGKSTDARSGTAAEGDVPGAGADRVRCVWHAGPERDIAVAALGEWEPAHLVRQLSARYAGRGGIGPVVPGLAELSLARRLAEVALLTCPPDGTEIVTLEQRLPAALVVSQPELADRLVRDVLGPLLTLPPADRELLVATLDAWLECGGSAGRAAGRLYCHRNTVLNRLRRLERLTAKSLSWPRELVELTLALDALRLTPSPP